MDGTELLVAERHGVEIDYCPKCRGVWLDRGELDKIIERAVGNPREPNYSQPPMRPSSSSSNPYPNRQPQYGAPDYQQQFHRKKKKHFLEEIFDFD